MKNKCLLVLLLALGCCHVQAQKSQKDPLSEALVRLNQKVDSELIPGIKRFPLIGISTDISPKRTAVNTAYVQSVILSGGIPYMIPVTDNVEILRQIVSQLDGIVFTGGEDIQPMYYGDLPYEKLEEVSPARDTFDLMVLKMAADRNIPILGICRGLQLMNVAFGGTLYQDLPTQHPSSVNHRQKESGTTPTHPISIIKESKLAEITGQEVLQVNTFHHQAIRKLAPGFKITAWAPDSIAEAIEAYPIRQMIGVQFHPEIFTAAGDTTMHKLFKFLVNKADTFNLAKKIHSRILSIDTHTDTPLWFKNGYSVGLRKDNMVSIPKMEEGKLDAQFLAAFIWQGKRDDASSQKAVESTTRLIQSIYDEVEQYKDFCGIALTEEDLIRLKREGKKAFFIGIENGYAIGKDLKNIAKYKQMGVNYITLCHSYDNDICHSSTHTEDATEGLTRFGREVVKEMNRLGIMIDVSHASEGTFWDVIKYSTQPIIASHSSSKALCDHDRNLTDEQLRALAKNGGVAQLCLLDAYINKNPKAASVCDAAEHLDHMIKVAGIDHVGIGTDFDGGGGLQGCNGDNDLINLTIKMIEKGYTEEDLIRLKREGKKAFFIGIENGYAIGKDLKNIKKYKQMGVNYITLCHSYDNDICHSSTHTEDATQGLTQFGREVVKEMNRLGIMIDISHASEGTFWDVIKYSTQPIIASHSSSKALCDHDRNLTDEQLRALAKNGGVAQLCLLDAYINKNPKAASICDAVEHLDHMIKVAGINHVGIGTDFDGGGGLQGCKGDNDLINLTIKMIEKGYTEEDLRKIWGGNLLRVMKQVQEAPLLSSKKRR